MISLVRLQQVRQVRVPTTDKVDLMKKILAVIMAGLIILVGCSSKQPDYKITPTQAIEILETGENIILYLGSRECSACQALAPTF